jgi:beta-galactosidase
MHGVPVVPARRCLRPGLACALTCLLLAASSAGAELLPHQEPRWGAEPVEELSAARGRIVLNGVWRFMPAVDTALNAPAGDWGLIRVPGAWCRQGWRVPPLDGVLSRGPGGPSTGLRNGAWQVDLSELGRAWYEREIEVPTSWRGREIVLNVERLCTDAIVYVDGKACGQVLWPGGEAVLTPHLDPGHKAMLRLLVACADRPAAVQSLLEGSQVRTAEPRGNTSFARGLVGDVILESRPKGARVDGVFVRTSVRRHELALDVDLVDVAQAGRANFIATILEADGKVARRFESSAALSDAPAQTVRLAWGWDDPRLWDVQEPNLYTLMLKAEGPGLSDEYRQRFGFREFRISGRDFLLNEKPLRLRPQVCKFICHGGAMREGLENQTDSLLAAGFNFLEIWPMVEVDRGLALFWKLRVEVCDEKGLPLMYPALNPSRFIGRRSTDQDWATWEEAMVKEWKKVRNHPSIVILVCTANLYQHFNDQSPTRIGNRAALAADTSNNLATLFAPGFRIMDVIRKYETTRPVTTHHGASVGDFHALDMYLNMIPLQEREEWLSAWAQSEPGEPYMNVEMGTPWIASMHRSRAGGPQARVSEPYVTEYCAIYFGADAYHTEEAAYRDLIRSKFIGGFEFTMWGGAGNPDYDYHTVDYVFLPSFQRLQELFIRNVWRSWRTWGMTGGMIPWDNGYGWRPKDPEPAVEVPPFKPGSLGPYVSPSAFAAKGLFNDAPGYYYGLAAYDLTPAGRALVESNSATLAWIAGQKEAFTAKDHNLFAGDRVRKQAVLINDLRYEQPYEASWTAELGARRIASGREAGRIGLAQTLFFPIEFAAPEVEAKTAGTITLQARIGSAEHRDALSFRVFPRPARPGADAPVLLAFDPAGQTTAMLERLGWRTRPWDGGQAPGQVLLIGQKALDGGAALPGSLEAFVAGGGRAIIFGQDPDWLRDAVGLRVARHVSRRFYPVPTGAEHPLIAGLDAEDLRDWAGAGTLVPPTHNTELEQDYSNGAAISAGRAYGWHWGNRGSVSSAAVEKPHLSGWRPILEGEFDLAYSPLMELNYGKGIAIWCSLDLAGRTEMDPVAGIIAARLPAYAVRAEAEPRAESAVYLGGPAGEEMLKLMGVRYRPADAVPDEPALLIVGPDYAAGDAAIKAFLAHGGKALFLARAAGELPLGFKAAEAPYHGAQGVPSWPECRGLSESDLRLRADVPTALLVPGPGQTGSGGALGRLEASGGVALLMQLAPSALEAEKYTYLRFSSWRIARATAQLLANMGATFEADGQGLKRLGGEGEAPSFYCPGYITRHADGDDPYRYKRW